MTAILFQGKGLNKTLKKKYYWQGQREIGQLGGQLSYHVADLTSILVIIHGLLSISRSKI